jgi:integrase
VTVADLAAAFWRYAELHYRKPDGTPTNELNEYRVALRPVRHLYGNLPAEEFTPLKLKAVRELMVRGYTHPKHGEQRGLARRVVNRRVGRVMRAFKWGVGEELVPEFVWSALRSVEGLERGRTEARETEPVTPVASEIVEATLPYLLPPVRAMVRVQFLTGMRPGEACLLRACDIDMAGRVWLFRPKEHKTAHQGKERVIAIGPKAQEALKPWLKLDLEAYLFCPREAVAAKLAARAAARKTPLSCGNRPGTNQRKKPTRRPGERYTTRSYYHAVQAAVTRADHAARQQATREALEAGREPPAAGVVFVPPWHPNQLRHARATEVRRRFGLEAAQVALGHSSADVTGRLETTFPCV